MEPSQTSECKVVSGHFAPLVQGFLGLTVLLTLVYKRCNESQQRPWLIWFMDSSKQGFAMGLQHGVNLLLAVLFARGGTQAGECIWYITNFSITVVCGLVILSVYMRLHRYAVDRFQLTWLRSGEYGSPPHVGIWLTQMLLWGFVCCVEKAITAVLVILPLHDKIDAVIAQVEMPLKHYPKIELVLVMVVMPMLLNATFAWIVDNLIRKAPDSDEVDDDIEDGASNDDSPMISPSAPDLRGLEMDLPGAPTLLASQPVPVKLLQMVR